MCILVDINNQIYKKPLPNERKSGKTSKEDEALDTIVVVLKKAQDQKEEDAFDIYDRHVVHELHVINNVFKQNWAKLKIQKVLYQTKLTAITPQTSTQAPNSAQTFRLEPHPPIQTLNPTQAIQQGFMSPEYTPRNSPVFNQTHFT